MDFDEQARGILADARDGELHLVANRRQAGDDADYTAEEAEQRVFNPIPTEAPVVFLGVTVTDPSSFAEVPVIRGVRIDGHRGLRVDGAAVPDALASILLALRDDTGLRPHCYFQWSEGNPVRHLVRYLLSAVATPRR